MKKSSRDHRKWIREIRSKFRKELQSGGIGDTGPRGNQGSQPVNHSNVYQWQNPDVAKDIKELQESLDDIFGSGNIKVEHKKNETT